MPRYIRVSDLQRKVRELNEDIRRCKNAKVKARLVEEQAAYTITLRNIPQHEMERPRITVTQRELSQHDSKTL
jgi:hypothetical protein